LFRRENDVPPYRVSQRIHRPRRLGSYPVGMHPHPAEVVAEARLHESARVRVERLAGRAQHLVHDRRHRGSLRLARGMALPAQSFLATLSALPV